VSHAHAGRCGFHPVYSPDGQWIYAASTQRILRVPTDGGPASDLAQTRPIADVSADGRFVYFLREPHDVRVWRADTGNGQIESVLEGLVPACTSCWALAPGGSTSLAATAVLRPPGALLHELQSGKNRTVAEYPEPLWPLGSGPFSLSPDGAACSACGSAVGKRHHAVLPFR